MIPKGPALRLLGILFLALCVRLPGVLHESALAQSDAYTHLQFLRDIATRGRLRHSLYPPGYYWLTSLPVRLFGLDLYHTARFAGLFYGVGLVVAGTAAVRAISTTRAALWTGFLLAGFPALTLLHKTGLGMYPNQLGLLLTPLTLLAWFQLWNKSRAAAPCLLVLVGVFAVSVPMMLVDLSAFFFFDFCVRVARGKISAKTLPVLGLCVLVPAFMFFRVVQTRETGAILETLSILARDDLTGLSLPRALLRPLWIYVIPKRGLPGGPVGGAAAVLSGLVVLGCGLWLRRARRQEAWLSFWWGFTWFQTVFACFQFPAYFRAGWFFLLAAAMVGGGCLDQFFQVCPRALKRVGQALLIGSAAITLWFYPRNTPHLSPAESDLVTFAMNQRKAAESSAWQNPKIWSRRWNSFPGNLGDPLHALWEDVPAIRFTTLDAAAVEALVFDPGEVHWILLDDRASPAPTLSWMRWVDPDLTREFEENQKRMLDVSRLLRQKTEAMSEQGWSLQTLRTPQGLEVVKMERQPSRTPPQP